MEACPKCGYCPTCGRSNEEPQRYQFQPIPQYSYCLRCGALYTGVHVCPFSGTTFVPPQSQCKSSL